MRVVGLYATLLAAFSAVVHSFPTAENFAKLAERGLLDTSNLDPLQLHESLLKIKEKRLLFDPLTTPIDGEQKPTSTTQERCANSKQSVVTMHSKHQILMVVTSVGLALV